MVVGVLGGGLQGCCIALALAERRVRVTLFDKNDALLSRAAIANEGKIHLGYMYAGDATLSTAKTMMAGALAFAPFLERYLSKPGHSFSLSVPATYIVHRDSQHAAEDVCAYLTTVHELINEAAERRRLAYFGKNLHDPLRLWSAAEKAAEFDQEVALAAVSNSRNRDQSRCTCQNVTRMYRRPSAHRGALRSHRSWGGNGGRPSLCIERGAGRVFT